MDVEEKDERTAEMEARMYEPLEWDSPGPYKIQDLKEPQFNVTLRLIKHHFFREEPMCKSSMLLQDQLSVNEYLEVVRSLMKDTTSLVAVSLASGRVVGTVVTRINSDSEKTNTYSRMQIFEGKALKRIMQLKNTLIKQSNAYEKFGRDDYLRIYILCVHPSYRDKGVDTALLKACTQVAKNMNIPAIGGIFTSGRDQSTALNCGFRIFEEIRYGRWVIDDEVIFDDPGRGNYSAAFMGIVVTVEENI